MLSNFNLVLGAKIRCDCNFSLYQLTFKNLNFVYSYFNFYLKL